MGKGKGGRGEGVCDVVVAYLRVKAFSQAPTPSRGYHKKSCYSALCNPADKMTQNRAASSHPSAKRKTQINQGQELQQPKDPESYTIDARHASIANSKAAYIIPSRSSVEAIAVLAPQVKRSALKVRASLFLITSLPLPSNLPPIPFLFLPLSPSLSPWQWRIPPQHDLQLRLRYPLDRNALAPSDRPQTPAFTLKKKGKNLPLAPTEPSDFARISSSCGIA